MDQKRAKDIPWLEGPSRGLVDGLLSSGLISKNTPIKLTKRDDNLKASPIPARTAREPPRPSTSLKSSRERGAVTSRTARAQTPTMSARQVLTTPRVETKDVEVDIFAIPARPRKNSQPKAETARRVPTIEGLLSHEKRLPARQEAAALGNDYRSFLESMNLDDMSDPATHSENVQKCMDITLYTMNKLIMQIRGYSDESAKLLNDIKLFFMKQIASIPGMTDYYASLLKKNQKDLSDAQEQIDALKKEIEYKEDSIMGLTLDIDESQLKFDKLTNEIQALEEKNEKLIMENDDLDSANKTLSFRLAKLEEQRQTALDQVDATKKELENTRTQIKHQDELISKYESEGAGFRPLYVKVVEDNTKLKEELEKLAVKMENMVEKVETVDIEVQTDELLLPTREGGRKKKKKRVESSRKPPESGARNKQKLVKTMSDSSVGSVGESKSMLLTLPQTTNTPLQPSPNESPRETTQTETPEGEHVPKRRIVFQDDPARLSLLRQKSTDIQTIRGSISDALDLQRSNSVATMAQNDTVIEEEPDPLPTDYDIPHKDFVPSSALLSCVFRLLPLSLSSMLDVAPSQIMNSLLGDHMGAAKPYNWVLHQIVDFFHSLYSIDQLSNCAIDTATLFKETLKNSTKVEALAHKIFSDVVQGTIYFQTTSTCAKFFLQFLMKEFTIVDYKFFNMLFNFCFDYFYPRVAQIIDDPDLIPEFPQFLIHVDIATSLVKSLFSHEFENFKIDDIRKETKNSPHRDLIDFFQFSMKMLGFFRSTHQKFHAQVKNLLTLIGWSRNVQVTESMFLEFFVLVNPNSTPDELEKLWQRFKLEITMKDRKQGAVLNQASFINFCSDFPDIGNLVLSLPFLSTFDRALSSMPPPIQTLFSFLNRRFTKYIRQFYRALSLEMKELVAPTIVRHRNALLMCDVTTALFCYRHFLQLIDLKMTDDTPYIILAPDVTPEDIDEIAKRLQAREGLATSWFRSHPDFSIIAAALKERPAALV